MYCKMGSKNSSQSKDKTEQQKKLESMSPVSSRVKVDEFSIIILNSTKKKSLNPRQKQQLANNRGKSKTTIKK
jgi:hypothetical protein